MCRADVPGTAADVLHMYSAAQGVPSGPSGFDGVAPASLRSPSQGHSVPLEPSSVRRGPTWIRHATVHACPGRRLPADTPAAVLLDATTAGVAPSRSAPTHDFHDYNLTMSRLYERSLPPKPTRDHRQCLAKGITTSL